MGGETMSMNTCRARKKDGSACTVPARPSGFCWVHDPDPELAGRRARGRRQGGVTSSRAAVLPPETPDVPLGTVHDVVGVLAQSVNQVRKGALAPGVANAVGYLSSVLLKALVDGDLAEQMAELRREVEELKRAKLYHATRNGSHPDGPAAA